MNRPTGFSPGEYPEVTRDGVNVEIAQIWAQTTAGVIGDGSDMPWYLPEDLQHFKESTQGFPVVMGRTSWEALGDPYRPLPGRENWVVTRDENYDAPGGHLCTSLSQAIAEAAEWAAEHGKETVWILGGGQVYAQCMPICDRVVITEVDMVAPSRFSVYAPEIPDDFVAEATEWATSEKGHTVDGKGDLRYRIVDWRRK